MLVALLGIESRSKHTNDVVAVPSLHAAFSLLITLTPRPRRRKWPRPLVASYPLATAFSLIDTGEHHVADVLLGWTHTIAIAPSARALDRHRRHQRSGSATHPSPEFGFPGEPHPEAALVYADTR